MRDALFRMIRWNCLAAGRMMTTHRNERELRTNLLIAMGQVVELRRRFWLQVPIGRGWPADAWDAPGTPHWNRAADSDTNRIIRLADRPRRRGADSLAGGAG